MKSCFLHFSSGSLRGHELSAPPSDKDRLGGGVAPPRLQHRKCIPGCAGPATSSDRSVEGHNPTTTSHSLTNVVYPEMQSMIWPITLANQLLMQNSTTYCTYNHTTWMHKSHTVTLYLLGCVTSYSSHSPHGSTFSARDSPRAMRAIAYTYSIVPIG